MSSCSFSLSKFTCIFFFPPAPVCALKLFCSRGFYDVMLRIYGIVFIKNLFMKRGAEEGRRFFLFNVYSQKK